MTRSEALRLAKHLDASVGFTGAIRVTETHIVFRSPHTGEHSLALVATTRARMIAHWAGFLGNQPAASVNA